MRRFLYTFTSLFIYFRHFDGHILSVAWSFADITCGRKPKKRTRRGKSASLFIKKSAQPSGRSAEKTDSDTAEQTCQKAGGVKSLSCFVLPTSRQKPGRPAYPHEKPKSLNQGVGFIQEPRLNALRRNFLFFYSRTHTVSVNGSDPENVNPRKECRNRKDPRCRLSLQKV